MYYFKEQKTLRVVSRPHQFNMEAIDGKLIEIDSTAPCLLLSHVPNKAWSYDVNILEKLDAEEGAKRLNPLPQKSDKPRAFYAVVLESDYNEYIRDYAFRELPGKTKEPKPDIIIQANPKPQVFNFGDAKTIDSATEKTKFDYTPRLKRTGEKPTYKFKSGSERYG